MTPFFHKALFYLHALITQKLVNKFSVCPKISEIPLQKIIITVKCLIKSFSFLKVWNALSNRKSYFFLTIEYGGSL